jgi:hypothetical protein
VDVSYTVKITVPTSAKTPALALHEAGEKWNETKAKFEEIGGVEVVRVAPVIVPVAQRNGSENGEAPAGRGRRQAEPVGATAE